MSDLSTLYHSDPYDLSGQKAAAEAMKREEAFKQQSIEQQAEQTKQFFAEQDRRQIETYQDIQKQAAQRLEDQAHTEFWDQKKQQETQAGMEKELHSLNQAARQAEHEWRTDFTQGICKDEVAAQYNKEIQDNVGMYKQRLDDLGTNSVDAAQTTAKYEAKLRDDAAPQIEQKTAEIQREHFPEYLPGSAAPAVEAPHLGKGEADAADAKEPFMKPIDPSIGQQIMDKADAFGQAVTDKINAGADVLKTQGDKINASLAAGSDALKEQWSAANEKLDTATQSAVAHLDKAGEFLTEKINAGADVLKNQADKINASLESGSEAFREKWNAFNDKLDTAAQSATAHLDKAGEFLTEKINAGVSAMKGAGSASNSSESGESGGDSQDTSYIALRLGREASERAEKAEEAAWDASVGSTTNKVALAADAADHVGGHLSGGEGGLGIASGLPHDVVEHYVEWGKIMHEHGKVGMQASARIYMDKAKEGFEDAKDAIQDGWQTAKDKTGEFIQNAKENLTVSSNEKIEQLVQESNKSGPTAENKFLEEVHQLDGKPTMGDSKFAAGVSGFPSKSDTAEPAAKGFEDSRFATDVDKSAFTTPAMNANLASLYAERLQDVKQDNAMTVQDFQKLTTQKDQETLLLTGPKQDTLLLTGPKEETKLLTGPKDETQLLASPNKMSELPKEEPLTSTAPTVVPQQPTSAAPMPAPAPATPAPQPSPQGPSISF